MNPQIWWYLARATGIVAWFAASGAVLVGLALASRIGGRQVPPAWLLALHRHLGMLAVAFTGGHIASLIADSYVRIDVVDVLVPFAASWHPRAVAWGVLAMWLLVIVEVTSLLRRRLSLKSWRTIHLSSYVAAIASTAHMLTAGTDAGHPVLRWAPIVGVAVGAVFLTYRGLQPRRKPVRPVRAASA